MEKRSAMRQLHVRRFLGISTVALIFGSVLVRAPEPARANSSFTVQLATTQVAADNLSDYPDPRVGLLVQMADRGMATTDPLHNNVAGEMQSGDRVVVTDYGIYWLDVSRRGGLLSGMWALQPSSSTGADFQYVANDVQWSPNEFLPGADGSNARSAFRISRAEGLIVCGAAAGAAIDTAIRTSSGDAAFTGTF